MKDPLLYWYTVSQTYYRKEGVTFPPHRSSDLTDGSQRLKM